MAGSGSDPIDAHTAMTLHADNLEPELTDPRDRRPRASHLPIYRLGDLLDGRSPLAFQQRNDSNELARGFTGLDDLLCHIVKSPLCSGKVRSDEKNQVIFPWVRERKVNGKCEKSERRAMIGIMSEGPPPLHSSLLKPFSWRRKIRKQERGPVLAPPCRRHLPFGIAWDNPAPVHDDAASGTV
jgi:hypothetical protein